MGRDRLCLLHLSRLHAVYSVDVHSVANRRLMCASEVEKGVMLVIGWGSYRGRSTQPQASIYGGYLIFSSN
ncbi:hypothetical protein CHARACLAT_026752 [Characodon lateralis]|uniref:Uncharacterized protein n=1 Tax=Characodon lateralis TaxID=208331 RepID=A0ABU7E4H6_9TELE|nr:hypothetical protein [Characodon lateralis]